MANYSVYNHLYSRLLASAILLVVMREKQKFGVLESMVPTTSGSNRGWRNIPEKTDNFHLLQNHRTIYESNHMDEIGEACRMQKYEFLQNFSPKTCREKNVEILGVHGAFYYDYQPAVFQVATQFNQNPTSTFAYETCRRTNMAQYYEYSSRKFF